MAEGARVREGRREDQPINSLQPNGREAAGGVLTAKQAPRRPGTAPAPGLRAWEMSSPFYRRPTGKGRTNHVIPQLAATPPIRPGAGRKPSRAAGLASGRDASAKLEVLEDRSVPAFLAPVDYPVGEHPTDVKAGDFNNDAIPDLVTANIISNAVSVLLGNGDGTFQPARELRHRPRTHCPWRSATSTGTASSTSRRPTTTLPATTASMSCSARATARSCTPPLSTGFDVVVRHRRRRPERRRQAGPRGDVAVRLCTAIATSTCCSATATELSRPYVVRPLLRRLLLAGAGRFQRRRQRWTWPCGTAIWSSWATATARSRSPATSASIVPVPRRSPTSTATATRPGRDRLERERPAGQRRRQLPAAQSFAAGRPDSLRRRLQRRRQLDSS